MKTYKKNSLEIKTHFRIL